MTKRRRYKQLIRARMAATGETYEQAKRNLGPQPECSDGVDPLRIIRDLQAHADAGTPYRADIDLSDPKFGLILNLLPDGLRVEGDFLIEDAPGLTRLPKGLHALSLTLQNCPNLTVLPDGIEIQGEVKLSRCHGLKGIPGDLVCEGIAIEECDRMEVVPQTIVNTGSLGLFSCPSLKELQTGLQIGESFYLVDCPEVVRVPELPEIPRFVTIKNCRKLEVLPNRIVATRGDVAISGCPGIRDWPREIEAGIDLFITDCPTLRALPATLAVKSDIHLSDCPGLEALPDGLHVGGWFTLVRCTGLRQLPSGLKVAGVLRLNQSSSLIGLPDDLDAGGIEGWDHENGRALDTPTSQELRWEQVSEAARDWTQEMMRVSHNHENGGSYENL